MNVLISLVLLRVCYSSLSNELYINDVTDMCLSGLKSTRTRMSLMIEKFNELLKLKALIHEDITSAMKRHQIANSENLPVDEYYDRLTDCDKELTVLLDAIKWDHKLVEYSKEKMTFLRRRSLGL